MRCLTSEDDIINLTGVVQVHVIKSKDRFQSAFCFISSTNKKKCILQYTTESPKGPIACFTPEVLEGEIKWETKGIIKIFEKYRESDWCDSTYCMDIGQEQFYRYQQWLIPWLKKHRVYSVFEGDSTTRTFLTDSFNFFCKTLTDRVQTRAPLFLPEVDTYSISFTSREKVTAVGVSDITGWYDLFSYSHEGKSIYQAIDTINSRDYIYLRDVESGRSRYYLLVSPRIKIVTEKIPTPVTLLPAMMEDKTITARQTRRRAYNTADQTSSRTGDRSFRNRTTASSDARAGTSSSSEDESDTIVLADVISFYQRENVDEDEDECIPVSSRPQFKSYRERDSSSSIPLDNRSTARSTGEGSRQSRRVVTRFVSTSHKDNIEESEELEQDNNSYKRFFKPDATFGTDSSGRTVKKKISSVGVANNSNVVVGTPGITLATTPCVNPSGIAGVCTVPLTPDLPNSNGIAVVIIFVTLLIIFIIVFVIIYIHSEETAYIEEQPYGSPGMYGPPAPYGIPGFYPGS